MQDFFYLNFLLHKNSPGIQTLLSISPELFLFLHDLIAPKFSYSLTNRDLPVIFFGCSLIARASCPCRPSFRLPSHNNHPVSGSLQASCRLCHRPFRSDSTTFRSRISSRASCLSADQDRTSRHKRCRRSIRSLRSCPRRKPTSFH